MPVNRGAKLDKSKPITIYCPEGFAYIAWQRCVCIQNGNNVTQSIVKLVMTHDKLKHDPLKINDGQMFYANGSMFVLSGESFTLSDLAEAIREAVGLPEVISVDYDEPDPKDYPNINRILVILGRNAPGGNPAPYDFPSETSEDILKAVEAEAAQYKTDDELKAFLYDESRYQIIGYRDSMTIMERFASGVFSGDLLL